MIKTLLKLILILTICVLFTNSAYSAVQAFSQYDTEIIINSDKTIDINKTIRLQNIHSVGIVPGRIEFSIGKQAEGSVSEVKLENFQILDRYGDPYKSQIFETPQETRIAIDIFTPLLPGFEHIIDLSYTISYEDSGLFFKNLEIPIKEESSIDIVEGTISIQIPDGRYFTYISDLPNSSTVIENIATWDINDQSPSNVRIEYSIIPVKVGGLKGSYVFWILINIVLISILIREIRREVRKIKK
jgi:hypothetical protein